MVHIGRVSRGSGPCNVLVKQPSVIFRPTKLSVTALIKVTYPLWMRMLAWIVVPWFTFDSWDVDPDESRWRAWFNRDLWHFGWHHPIGKTMYRFQSKKQTEALASCKLVSVRVANVEAIVPGPSFPLGVLWQGHSPQLDLPTCTPQNTISIEFSGIPECDFDVSMQGWAAT